MLNKPLWWISPLDKILAVCLTLLVLESSRRFIGLIFPTMAGLFFLYAYLGPWLPGYWAHKQFTVNYIFQVLYHSTNGIWGSMVGISSTMLAMFAIFGGVLASRGAPAHLSSWASC